MINRVRGERLSLWPGRARHVFIELDIERDGSLQRFELPLVIVVMANLSGTGSKLSGMHDHVTDLDGRRFEAVLKEIGPTLQLDVPNRLSRTGNLQIDLRIQSLEDFCPSRIAQSVPQLQDLLAVRGQLQVLDDRSRAVHAGNEPATPSYSASFTEDLGLARRAMSDIGIAVDEAKLMEFSGTTVQGLIALIDARLQEQIGEVIGDDAFVALEGTWRGLHFLVTDHDAAGTVRIGVLDLDRTTLASMLGPVGEVDPASSQLGALLGGYRNADRSPLPVGCVIGDYYFDGSPTDIALLERVAATAATLHSPFVTGVAPEMMHLERWASIEATPDAGVKIKSAMSEAWSRLRDSSDSRYLYLTLPRFRARARYRAVQDVAGSVRFEEPLDGMHRAGWANSAYLVAANVIRAFQRDGWLARIRGLESGGMPDRLPFRGQDDDPADVRTLEKPVEATIGYALEAAMAEEGFMPILHLPNSDTVAFIGARSVNRPAITGDADTDVDVNLAARLPCVLVCGRFALALEFLARSFSSMDGGGVERLFLDWLMNYVDGDPAHSSDSTKARKPLTGAEVSVLTGSNDAHSWTVKVTLRPHYQFNGRAPSFSFEIHKALPGSCFPMPP